MFGGLLATLVLACGPRAGGTDDLERAPSRPASAPAPEIVWKGIDCGPGPIAPAGPRLGSGLGPEGGDAWTVPKPPDKETPTPAAPPVCRPPEGSPRTTP
ncbi:MAG: hypothetical protein QM820_38480 [Minicystis sp.]